MLYTLFEMSHAALTPVRAAAQATQSLYTSPFNPLSATFPGRSVAAAAEVFQSVTRRYGKPAWSLSHTRLNDVDIPIAERAVWSSPWCKLVHFERDASALKAARGPGVDPKLLIVAPMSGHFATLLRGTVEPFLPDHEVYVTDWSDARMVPIGVGRFDLDDYVDHIRAMLRHLGPHTHVLAVCQPGPPVLAAISLMAEDKDPATPASMTFIGSPIDTRRSPTEPNRLAQERPFAWFQNNMIYTTPWPNPGFLRRVYPGFVQLASFMNMNWDRHVDAHWSFFEHLVAGDGDNAERHRDFYDEYLSVCDLSEEFYLQTIERVFQSHALPRGEWRHKGERVVRPDQIRQTALFTIEGELDDISGIGQTQAAHDLCVNLPAALKRDHVQPGVGHYGVFNGSRFRRDILPKITGMIRDNWDMAADKRLRTGRKLVVAAE